MYRLQGGEPCLEGHRLPSVLSAPSLYLPQSFQLAGTLVQKFRISISAERDLAAMDPGLVEMTCHCLPPPWSPETCLQHKSLSKEHFGVHFMCGQAENAPSLSAGKAANPALSSCPPLLSHLHVHILVLHPSNTSSLFPSLSWFSISSSIPPPHLCSPFLHLFISPSIPILFSVSLSPFSFHPSIHHSLHPSACPSILPFILPSILASPPSHSPACTKHKTPPALHSFALVTHRRAAGGCWVLHPTSLQPCWRSLHPPLHPTGTAAMGSAHPLLFLPQARVVGLPAHSPP